jgi:hypothetical protein
MSTSLVPTRDQVRARYRVRLLVEPRLSAAGVHFVDGAAERLLPWDRVELALAAEVGEPEGVRTMVFDLVSGRERGARLAWRLDAEPGQDAVAIAKRIETAVGPARLGPSIKSLAAEGVPSQWYPDVEAFEAAVVEALCS